MADAGYQLEELRQEGQAEVTGGHHQTTPGKRTHRRVGATVAHRHCREKRRQTATEGP